MIRVLFAFLMLPMAACQRIDQPKFEQLYRAGKALERGTSPLGTGPGELVQALETEIKVARTRARTSAEENLIGLYRDAWFEGLEYSLAWRREMMIRERELLGQRRAKEESPDAYHAAVERVQHRLQVAARCYETSGDSCLQAEDLTGKNAGKR